MRKRFLPLVALAAACAVGPTYERPVIAVAPAYHADSDSVVNANTLSTPFWEELGDTTLARLVSVALSASPDITIAEARVRDARASRLTAQLDFAPAITAAAGYTHQQFATAQLPGVPDQFRRFDLWDAGFDASWELDVFGRIRKNVGAQSAFVASAEQDVRATRVTLSAEVARVYFDLRGAQSELEVARRNAQNQQRTLALTQERLGAGRGTAFDTERAQSQLSTTLAVTPLLEARYTADAHQLDVLLGRVPGAAAKELAAPAQLPPLPTSVHVGSPEQLVAERPDVLSAERQLAAQTALIGSSVAEYFPKLLLNGSLGLTATRFDSLGDPGTTRYAVGPLITWPFLDIGRVKARVDASRAAADAARANYTATVLRAVAEAETAITAYERSRSRLADLDAAATASQRAAELARLRFTEGVTDFLQVLDAERTLLDAQSQLEEGKTFAATSLVAVYKAVGGTWPDSAQ